MLRDVSDDRDLSLERGEARARAGILHPSRAVERIDVGRVGPSPVISGFVDYIWSVVWNCPEPHVQEVVPRPVIHLTAEVHDGRPRLLVNGVMRKRFERRLTGQGRTVAAAFRPGGFRPFLGSGVRDLTDRIVPVGEVTGFPARGVDDAEVAARLLDPSVDTATAAHILDRWLVERCPPPDPVASEIARLVELAEADPSITRADHLAALSGVGLRTLQRQFTEYVGVGPKWVVQRFRLLDVAAAAHAGGPVDWAALAAELGYSDQSHLIRAFTALVGRPPASYASCV